MKKVYLIATFVAILAGIATYLFATQIQSNTKIKDAPTTSVVVAVVNIAENTVITPEMVTIKYFPTVSVVLGDTGAATKLDDVVGKLNRYPVIIGEQIFKSKISALGAEVNKGVLSYQLSENEYAYSISVETTSGVSGFIGKGDYVDLLYTITEPGAMKPTTTILMTDLHVLRISNYAANYASEADKSPITAYSEVVFSLNKEQILLLTNKIAEGGSIMLALKPITTGEKYTKPATTAAAAETTAVAVATTAAVR